MIKRISRNNLDVDKYTECLNKSVNYLIYAEVWYLDALIGENWDCYVLKDFEAIMPLPFSKKLGIKIITQPIYCQQLGVFHQKNLSKETFQIFEKKLHRNLVRAYAFNEENTEMFEPKGLKRVNQILDISGDYISIYQKFNSNRRRNISKNELSELVVEKNEFKIASFISILKHQYLYSEKIDLNSFERLVQSLISKHKICIYSLVNKKKSEPISAVILINSGDRIILLSSVRDKIKEPKGSFSFLLHHIMRENIKKKLIFDFEGSSLIGVQKFNSSFGAETKYYTVYKTL